MRIDQWSLTYFPSVTACVTCLRVSNDQPANSRHRSKQATRLHAVPRVSQLRVLRAPQSTVTRCTLPLIWRLSPPNRLAQSAAFVCSLLSHVTARHLPFRHLRTQTLRYTHAQIFASVTQTYDRHGDGQPVRNKQSCTTFVLFYIDTT